MIRYTKNMDNVLLSEFDKYQIKSDALFVDWIRTDGASPSDEIINQIAMVDKAVNDGIRMVIFDRYSSLNDEEVAYFRKCNAVLIEPCVNHRDGFQFLPFWVKRKDLPLSDFGDRKYDTGYKGKSFNEDMEKISQAILKTGELSIGIDCYLSKKYIYLRGLIDVADIQYKDFHTNILTGSLYDGNVGRIPDFVNLLDYGVVPLLHHNCKYMHFLFKDLVIETPSDIRWYVNFCKKGMGYSLVEHVYDNIDRYLPEMLVENFASKIIDIVR